MPPVPQMRPGFAVRVAGLYAAIFITAGIQLPFFPVWLKGKGLDASEIGLVLAAPILARMVAIPVATRAADRRDALREAIIIASCLSVAGYVLLGLVPGVGAILFAYVLASAAHTPMMPLVETYALKGLSARGRAYGPVRLWGSAAFIGGSFLAGFAADVIPARHLIWLIVAGIAFVAFAAFTLEPLGTAAVPASERPQQARSMLRDPIFIIIIISASLIQASHAVYYGFSALAWGAQGLDGTMIAALWGLGVIAEIVLFAGSGRLPPMLTMTVMLIIGGLGGALRWGAMAFDPPTAALPFLQLLHALSFGATHLGALTYLARNAPAGQGATAQGYLAVALGVAMAAVMGLSGVLYQAFGSVSYAVMGLVALAGSACAFIAHRARGGVAAA